MSVTLNDPNTSEVITAANGQASDPFGIKSHAGASLFGVDALGNIASPRYAGLASYTIFQDGSTVIAKNGQTGAILASGTDAATVIQAALTALTTAGGGLLLIKAGAYSIGTQLCLESAHDVTIAGEGSSTVLTAVKDLPFTHGANVMFWAQSCQRIRVTNLRCTGDATRATEHLLFFRYCDDVTVDHCILTDTDKEVSTFATQDEAGHKGYKFVHNTVRRHGCNATYLEGGVEADGDEIIIAHNLFDNESIGGKPGGVIAYGTNIIIANNIVKNCYQAVEVTVTTQYNTTTDNVLIQGNIGANLGTNGIRVYGACSNAQVLNNIMSLTAGYDGIFINTTGPAIIQGNTISGITRDAGIYLNTGGHIVRSNRLDSCKYGIWAYAGDANVIDLNTFSGTATAHVRVQAGVNNTVVRYNAMTSLMDSGTGTIVTNNRGYVTENSGSATILSGHTNVVVTHGLVKAPTKIICTGSETETAGCVAQAGEVGATTFMIKTGSGSAVTADRTVYWRAEV